MIYLAGPLFTQAEIEFNSKLYDLLIGNDVFLPQIECSGLTNPLDIFNKCKSGIDSCDFVLANIDGCDADSGTAWEIGYAYGKGIRIIGYRTDFRNRGDDGAGNLMLTKSVSYLIEEPKIENVVNVLKATNVIK